MQIYTTLKNDGCVLTQHICKYCRERLDSNFIFFKVGKDVEKGNPSALLVGMQTGAATVESSMEFPQKIKMELPFDPAIPLMGKYRKKSKTLI